MKKEPRAVPQRYVAFLRAINVGGHVVKMERLRAEFESLGLREVETFIASGNVLFGSTERDVPALERKIERQLAKALGYEVATFLRTPAELTGLVTRLPYADGAIDGCTLSVGFLKEPPPPASAERVLALSTSEDELRFDGREFLWLCRGRTSDSTVWRRPFEKVVGMPATFRNVTTVRKLAARAAPTS
jgi:uncharacterized protein (DUF1697 family)